jgi:hypothetical protein
LGCPKSTNLNSASPEAEKDGTVIRMIEPIEVDSPMAWTAQDLHDDPSWIAQLNDAARRDLVRAVRHAEDPDRTLIDYAPSDVDLGVAHAPIEEAFRIARHQRGLALLRGLPRAELTEAQFGLLTWAIGLHQGVARPQGKASQYLSAVRNEGADYRSSGGRGYSSNVELDFHIDGVDVVALTCYNQARRGGMSLVTSSVAAHNALLRDRPDVMETLYQPFEFSRQAEEASDESPTYLSPVFDTQDGRLFVKWNRNRILSAQRIEGVTSLDPTQLDAMQAIDDMLRHPDLLYTMYLQPGDVQILSSFTTLHSRTRFEDHACPADKRLLFRLWLTPPDAPRIPHSWGALFRSSEPATVRGGIVGHQYNDQCRAFDQRLAAFHGMTLPDIPLQA